MFFLVFWVLFIIQINGAGNCLLFEKGETRGEKEKRKKMKRKKSGRISNIFSAN